MNKKILFLYFTGMQKAELISYETVFKAFFRKFRKTADFFYLQIDFSLTCREAMRERICTLIPKFHAVFLYKKDDFSSSELEFMQDVFGYYATQNSVGGRHIFFPTETKTVSSNKKCIEETVKLDYDAVCDCVKLCTKKAKESHCRLCVCTGGTGIGDLLLKIFEENFSKKHIELQYLTPVDMIRDSFSYYPIPETVFTTKTFADVLCAASFSSGNITDGYSLLHTQLCKVYKALSFPFVYDENYTFCSDIIAFAAMVENELHMKNAAYWLRRSVSVSFAEFQSADKEELISGILRNLNSPMRKRL